MSESSARSIQADRARPRVSFVVAWKGCPNELSRRLRSWAQWARDGVDVVVACVCPSADRHRLARAYPDVRFLDAEDRSEVQALRELAVSSAFGDIVVIFDDSIGWHSTWREVLPTSLPGSRLRESAIAWGTYEPAAHRLDDTTVQ